MPCLNEAETVATCVRKAVAFLAGHGIDGEVLVADNGSSDGSRALAEAAGARGGAGAHRGSGNALVGGTPSANGPLRCLVRPYGIASCTAVDPLTDRPPGGYR